MSVHVHIGVSQSEPRTSESIEIFHLFTVWRVIFRVLGKPENYGPQNNFRAVKFCDSNPVQGRGTTQMMI